MNILMNSNGTIILPTWVKGIVDISPFMLALKNTQISEYDITDRPTEPVMYLEVENVKKSAQKYFDENNTTAHYILVPCPVPFQREIERADSSMLCLFSFIHCVHGIVLLYLVHKTAVCLRHNVQYSPAPAANHKTETFKLTNHSTRDI